MLGRSDQQLAGKAIEQYKEVLKRGDSGDFPSIMHGIMKRNMISPEDRPGLKYLIESAKDSWTKASSHSAASLQRFYGSLPPTPSGSYTISGSLTHPILSDRSGTLGTTLSSIGSPIPTFSTSGIITTGVVKPTESKVSFSSFSSFVESGEQLIYETQIDSLKKLAGVANELIERYHKLEETDPVKAKLLLPTINVTMQAIGGAIGGAAGGVPGVVGGVVTGTASGVKSEITGAALDHVAGEQIGAVVGKALELGAKTLKSKFPELSDHEALVLASSGALTASMISQGRKEGR